MPTPFPDRSLCPTVDSTNRCLQASPSCQWGLHVDHVLDGASHGHVWRLSDLHKLIIPAVHLSSSSFFLSYTNIPEVHLFIATPWACDIEAIANINRLSTWREAIRETRLARRISKLRLAKWVRQALALDQPRSVRSEAAKWPCCQRSRLTLYRYNRKRKIASLVLSSLGRKKLRLP